MPRSHQTSTVASLALFLLIAHASLASPIVKLSNPIFIKTSLNATSALPLNGPSHYAALALGGSEGSSLESRELKEYFEEAELVARGLEAGEVEPTPAPVSQAETAPAPEATQRSIFSIFSRPIFNIKNPKVVWNPKAHPPRTSSTTRSWSSVVSSTAAPTTSPAFSSSKKSTTTTKKSTTTTTTSSAAPTPTFVSCALTADCAGQPIPDFSHQYCASKICSFRCNSGFSLSNGACVKNQASSAITTTKVATTTAIPPAVPSATGCFPSSRSDIPTTPATASSLQQWWCPESAEYAFLGFSYALYSCPSQSQLLADFKRMKTEFRARYVRLYGYCDESWMNDALVEAAAGAGIGIYGLIWFGFDGTDEWKGRRDALIKTIQTNPKAPYVYRNIAVGSEPLYDWVLEPRALANEVNSVRAKLAQYGVKTTISEMPYGYQTHGGAPEVLQAIDFVEANVLPFFDGSATTGDRAWGMVNWSLDFFRQNAPGKRIVMTQTGWPSDTSVWKANNPTAVASVWSEKAYFDLLDSKCEEFRWNGGVGWFAQIWSDAQLGGWGILDWNGNKKFDFAPRITC